jgi:hypothetical protein
MNDLTNIIEWNEFAADRRTVLEVLTILNNRHREIVDRLERERDEARAEIAAAKIVLQQPDLPDEPLVVQAKRYVDQHEWQVGVNRGQATQIEKANRENADMREAIREAEAALRAWPKAGSGMSTDFNLQSQAFRTGQQALAKLQPFITP